jgi:hypothetical protein
MLPFILIAAIVAVVLGMAAALIWVNHVLERKRTEALERVAREMGLGFYPRDAGDMITTLSGFHLFSQGHSKKITNVMHGETNDMEVRILDYEYTTGSGKNSHTSRQTIVCFRSPTLDLPAFSLRPENIFHKIGALFGYQDIDFDAHPVFSKHYLLRGSDEEAIRSQFHEGVLTFYEEHRGLCTEGNGQQLIFYRAAQQVKPDEIRSFLDEGLKTVGLFRK